MTTKDQIAYLLSRELDHRERAQRALYEDTMRFHEGLAATFGRLAEEARPDRRHNVNYGEARSPYLDW